MVAVKNPTSSTFQNFPVINWVLSPLIFVAKIHLMAHRLKGWAHFEQSILFSTGPPRAWRGGQIFLRQPLFKKFFGENPPLRKVRCKCFCLNFLQFFHTKFLFFARKTQIFRPKKISRARRPSGPGEIPPPLPPPPAGMLPKVCRPVMRWVCLFMLV
jgi:hypothetical protein